MHVWLNRHRTHDELTFHRDKLIDDYVASGMDRRSAERRAFLQFGNVAAIAESSRDVRGRWLNDFAKDASYALRTLRRNPSFASVAVLSLALAIGANTAIFSLVNAVLLRPLPVHDPNRLVQITRLTPDGRAANVSYPLFEYLHDNLRTISGGFAHGSADESILIAGAQEFVASERVSGEYFNVLGIRPAAGRLLGPEDDSLATPAPAAVISDAYWQRRFSRDPSAVGRTFTAGDRVFTIVGVLPASFQSIRVGAAPDVVFPLLLMLSEDQRTEATNNSLRFFARLKPDATIEQASAEGQVLWRAFIEPIAANVPGGLQSEVLSRRVGALPGADGINDFRRGLGEPLLIVMGIVGVILLLVSVNLAGLLVARAAARQREVSVRLAIGAGRGRLVRQFLTESLVLACLGGALGLVFAGWLSNGLKVLFLNGRNLDLSVASDWRVFAFTAAVAVAVCLLAGLIPAAQAVRVSVNPALKEVRAKGPSRFSKILVVAQVAISMMLVVGATLFVGTLIKLYSVDRGFDSDGVLAVYVRSTGPFPTDRALALIGDLVSRLQALPGVEAASAAAVVPISGNDWTREIELPGDAAQPGESKTAFNVITPEYFSTLATRLVAGRDFNRGDVLGAPPVAIVNERFARDFFGDASPIGRRVMSVKVSYEIVGVVGDAVYQDLRDGIRQTMYVAAAQRDMETQPTSFKYLVRVANGDPARLAPTVARLVSEIDPALQMQSAVTYATLIDRSIPAERILATLSSLFAVLALVIAGIGMFALLAFQVARRTNEFGVRMVLGATRGSMVRMVLTDVAWMLLPGLALGAAGAAMVTGLSRGALFGLSPTDPMVFGIAAAILTGAGATAAWLPARRASRVDPLVALRHE